MDNRFFVSRLTAYATTKPKSNGTGFWQSFHQNFSARLLKNQKIKADRCMYIAVVEGINISVNVTQANWKHSCLCQTNVQFFALLAFHLFKTNGNQSKWKTNMLQLHSFRWRKPIFLHARNSVQRVTTKNRKIVNKYIPHNCSLLDFSLNFYRRQWANDL